MLTIAINAIVITINHTPVKLSLPITFEINAVKT